MKPVQRLTINSQLAFVGSFITFFTALGVQAAPEKGLLPEVNLNSSNEQENLERAAMSEALISKTEIKAIDSITKLLAKKKGSADEPNLLYRLAELHMRRAKSGRFFEINKSEKQKLLSAFPIPIEADQESLRKAIKCYTRLETEFPKYQEMDAVLFNMAFAHQQLRLNRVSEEKLKEMIQRFPKSPLIADALLALAEIQYDFQNFSEALKTYRKIEEFPGSRVYAYALYKSAWAAYNQKNSGLAIDQLKSVLKSTPADENLSQKGHHLRSEALRDLGIFMADTAKAEDIYPFFKPLATSDELAKLMIEMGKMYDSHSRQKDMIIFLGKFADKEPESAGYVSALLQMADANETLKKRDQVLENLQKAGLACRVSSSWRNAQNESVVEDSCKTQFKHIASEITKKWWEIWLKNKENKGKDVEEFAGLTEKSFEMLLANDDATKPDFKSRYAYAELLFQRQKFLEASAAYQKSSIDSNDAQLKHDADYAALLSLERHLENNKSDKTEIQRRVLVEAYLKNHPKGEYVRPVTLKLAVLQFANKEYVETENNLNKLIAVKTNDDIRTKAQDLLLEVLNQQGQTSKIKNLADSFKNESVTGERKKALNQIFEEASLSEIQSLLKDKKEDVAIKSLESFLDKNPSAKLKQEANWQLIGLLFKQKDNQKAIQRTNEYVSNYPTDPRSAEAASEVARIRIEQANLSAAAEIYMQAKEITKAAQLWTIEGEYSKLLDLIKSSAMAKKQKESLQIIEQLWLSKTSLTTSQREELKKMILSQDLEPMATEILTDEAQSLSDQGKTQKVYELTMKILRRSSPAALRAKAKILQSEILEKEMLAQSLKAKEDKLALVLALKTEKLDKAQTAYLSVLKMTDDANVQLQTLTALRRVYSDYINSITNISLASSIPEDQQKQIKTELSAITDPMKQKLKDNEAKIEDLQKKMNVVSSNFGGLKFMRSFIPSSFTKSLDETITPLVGKRGQCNTNKELSLQLIADCSADKKLEVIESLAERALQTGEASQIALYAKAVVANSRNKTAKAYWIIDRLLSKNEKSGFFVYEKARLANQLQDIAGSFKEIVKLADAENSLTEIRIFSALQAYEKQNFKKASDLFSRFNIDELYTYQVNTFALESHRQAGQVERAKQLQEKMQEHDLKLKSKTVGQNVSSGDLI